MKEKIIKLSGLLAFGIVFLMVSIFATTLITFVFKQSLSSWQFITGSIITAATIFTISSKLFASKSYLYALGVIGMIVLLFVGSLGISRQFLDVSYDGVAYHGEAMLQLSNGWNPIYEQKISNTLYDRHFPWLDGYPKASWINSVSIYKVTGNFEDGKLFNILIILASFFAAFAAFLRLKRLNWWWSGTLAFLAAINIVPVLQYNSYNLDGQVSSLITIVLAGFILLVTRPTILSKLLLYSSVILLMNIKTAGFVYAVIMCFGYLVYLLFRKREHVLGAFKELLIAGLLGMCIFGFNPYVTNTFNFAHPLYPVLGKNKVPAFDQNIPLNYVGKNNVEIFVASLFFKSDSVYSGPNDIAKFKIPFTFDKTEIDDAFRGIGPKKGGFGVFFSGILILCIIGYLMALYRERKLNDPEHETSLSEDIIAVNYIVITIIGSCLIFNNSNFARLVPQIWLLIITALYLLIIQKNIVFKIFSSVITVIILINVGVSGYFNTTHNLQATKDTISKLEYYRQLSQDAPLNVYFDNAISNRLRLDNAGIKYNIIDHRIGCKPIGDYFGQWTSLPDVMIEICPNK